MNKRQLHQIDAKCGRAITQMNEVIGELRRLSEIEVRHNVMITKVLRWIARTRQEAMADGETRATRWGVLADDLEALCIQGIDADPETLDPVQEALKQVRIAQTLCARASARRDEIHMIAQNALECGGTWAEADRLASLQDALETIVTLCTEPLKGED